MAGAGTIQNMQEPPFSLHLPDVEFEECATRIIPIDDDNYRAAIDWFKACLGLSQNLPQASRDDYELQVIGNVKNSLANFFQRTELSLSTLLGLEREVTAMIQGVGPPVASQYKLSSFNECDDADCDSSVACADSSDDEDDTISQLYKRFLWVTIASIILLILLALVLATMCWLRKYIERDMKEIFVACPSKEELRGSQGTISGRSILSKRKTTSGSPEFPEYEDEEYLQEYGDPSTYAYPIRFWMTPLNRKRQSAKQGKSDTKKSGADDEKMNNNK